MALAGQVHSCWKCNRRLPVDNVHGSVVVFCYQCKKPNVISVSIQRMVSREQC